MLVVEQDGPKGVNRTFSWQQMASPQTAANVMSSLFSSPSGDKKSRYPKDEDEPAKELDQVGLPAILQWCWLNPHLACVPLLMTSAIVDACLLQMRIMQLWMRFTATHPQGSHECTANIHDSAAAAAVSDIYQLVMMHLGQ